MIGLVSSETVAMAEPQRHSMIQVAFFALYFLVGSLL
jgi:hypothetical protein